MKLHCQHCGREWDYGGRNKVKAMCPTCFKSVKVGLPLEDDPNISNGVDVTCHNCKYVWRYKGSRLWCSCPSCHTKVNLKKNRKIRANGYEMRAHIRPFTDEQLDILCSNLPQLEMVKIFSEKFPDVMSRVKSMHTFGGWVSQAKMIKKHRVETSKVKQPQITPALLIQRKETSIKPQPWVNEDELLVKAYNSISEQVALSKEILATLSQIATNTELLYKRFDEVKNATRKPEVTNG